MSTHLHKRNFLSTSSGDYVELTAHDDRVSLYISSFTASGQVAAGVLADFNHYLAILEVYRDELAAHIERMEAGRREWLSNDSQ